MSALADIFAAVRLQLDGTGFEAQATALATKSGKNAGTVMSQNLSSSFKKAAGGAIGAGLGLAFASATSGALELNAAMADFKAQTGASDEAAQEFGKTLGSLNKTNVQSIAEIGATLTELQTNFKLTGDAAKGLAAQFLDFSRVAGGTAAEAVLRFDELVDAGVITADQMGVTMDKLVVSHQKFGVNINDTIAALIKFAPAMSAAGISTDDAIGLMNMFSESGLDAEAATKAFNIALGKVKSPEELRRLVSQIIATEDPFERAQLAADLFGKRAGVQLANALKPGSGGIEAWTVKAGEFTDATTAAGDALDSSFGNRAKLKLKEINGTLAEMGTNLGDLLLVFALAGPALTRGLLAGIGGLAGLFGPKLLALILPQAIATGAASGTAMGTAFGGAAAAAATVALIALPVTIILAAQGPVADFLGLSGKQTGPAGTWSPKLGGPFKVPVAVESVPGNEDASAQAYRDYLAALPDPGAGLDYGEWKKNAAAGGAAAGAAAGDAFVETVKLTAQKETIGPEDVFGLFGTSVDGVRSAAFSTGIAGMEAMAAGITAARSKPVDAFTTMKEMLKNAMTPTQEAARLAGQLTSKELAAGLRSGDPAVKAQAIAVRRTIIDRLQEITKDSGGIGKAAMDKLGEGIGTKDSQIRSAAGAARTAVLEELNGTKAGARTAGANAGATFVAGMLSRIPAFLRKAVEGQLHAAGVPGYAVGAWEVPRTQLAVVHAREMVLPAAAAASVRSGQAVVTAQGVVAGGAREQQITIEHVEIRDAHDEFSLIQQLRFLAAVG